MTYCIFSYMHSNRLNARYALHPLELGSNTIDLLIFFTDGIAFGPALESRT
jgi:hypothetical protein